VSPILGIWASAQQSAFLPGDYESIATTTVGAGGSSSVTFSGIPSTYTHLQVRTICQVSYSSNDYDSINYRFNSDTGSNYAYHILRGNGSNAAVGSGTSTDRAFAIYTALVSGSSSVFGTSIIDILDYANTNKYKTVRSIGGADFNGSGGVGLSSGLWMNTNAINSITFANNNGNWNQYTQFALYGIKG
jgi:hypothetical protein